MTEIRAEGGILVKLSTRMWSGQRVDHSAEALVAREKKAASDAGKYSKWLVPPSELKPVFRELAACRRWFREATLMWDEATGLLAGTNFFDFRNEWEKRKNRVITTRDKFCDKYPSMLEKAEARLGEMYRIEDFPHPDTMRGRFGAKIELFPLPDAGDFRVGLPEEALEKIRSETAASVTERLHESQRELWTRLMEVVEYFAEVMGDSGKVFRNSTVDKMVEFAQLAPKMAILPDAQLQNVCDEIVHQLHSHPDALRGNDALRATKADEARDMVEKIESVMKGAF